MTVSELKKELELPPDDAEVIVFVDDKGTYYREVEAAASTDAFNVMYYSAEKHDVGFDKKDGKECLVIYPLLNK